MNVLYNLFMYFPVVYHSNSFLLIDYFSEQFQVYRNRKTTFTTCRFPVINTLHEGSRLVTANVLSHSVVSDYLRPYGLQPTSLLFPWDSPGKNAGIGCHFLLQGIFPTQGSNLHFLCLLHCRKILYLPSGKPHYGQYDALLSAEVHSFHQGSLFAVYIFWVLTNG